MKRAEAGRISRPGSERWAAWRNICRRWYIWTHPHWQAEKKESWIKQHFKALLTLQTNLICFLNWYFRTDYQFATDELWFIQFIQYPVHQWLCIDCYISNDVTVNVILRDFLLQKLKSSRQCGKRQEIWPVLWCRTHMAHERSWVTETFHTFVNILQLKLLIHSLMHKFWHGEHHMRKFMRTEWTKMCVFIRCAICVTLHMQHILNDKKKTRLRWISQNNKKINLISNHVWMWIDCRKCQF